MRLSVRADQQARATVRHRSRAAGVDAESDHVLAITSPTLL